MTSLLPQEHREPLQKLRWKYKEAEKVFSTGLSSEKVPCLADDFDHVNWGFFPHIDQVDDTYKR